MALTTAECEDERCLSVGGSRALSFPARKGGVEEEEEEVGRMRSTLNGPLPRPSSQASLTLTPMVRRAFFAVVIAAVLRCRHRHRPLCGPRRRRLRRRAFFSAARRKT